MITSLTTARITRRAAAAAACAAALIAGATACGTEDGTASAQARTATSIDGAKANQAEYLQRLNSAAEAARQARAERADAARWQHGYPGPDTQSQGYGDDRRQPAGEAKHPSGFNKALPSER
jgi:hypothetical protein